MSCAFPGASIPDLTAVPDETEIGLVGSNASSLANTSEGTSVAASDDSSIADLTLVSAESQIAHQFHQFGSAASPGSNASNAANTSSVPSSAPSSEAMEAMSVAPIVPILRIDSELIKTNGSGNYTGPMIPSFKDCRAIQPGSDLVILRVFPRAARTVEMFGCLSGVLKTQKKIARSGHLACFGVVTCLESLCSQGHVCRTAELQI